MLHDYDDNYVVVSDSDRDSGISPQQNYSNQVIPGTQVRHRMFMPLVTRWCSTSINHQVV